MTITAEESRHIRKLAGDWASALIDLALNGRDYVEVLVGHELEDGAKLPDDVVASDSLLKNTEALEQSRLKDLTTYLHLLTKG